MSETATTETTEGQGGGWVDPGPMDGSIWVKKRPNRIETWIKRILLCALILLPVMIYLSSLWGLPDVGLPEQLATWRSRNLADEKNAAILYRIAADALPPRRLTLTNLTDWTTVGPEDRMWLTAGLRPLMVWREGTKRPDCESLRHRPETTRLTEPESALFGRLVVLEGLRLENQRRYEDALDWYIALLRFSRHQGRNTLFHERFRSLGLHQSAANRIRPWSDQPNLPVQLLQRALREVLASESLPMTATESILAEIDRLENALERPEVLDKDLGLDAFNRPGREVEGWAKSWSSFSRRFQAEPERSRRVGRLIFANWINAFETDRFRTRGQQLDYPSLLLFRNDGAEKQVVNPSFLASRLIRTRYVQHMVPHISGFVTAVVEDERNQRELVQHLAEHVFRRLNGRKPESIDEVNPAELSSPP